MTPTSFYICHVHETDAKRKTPCFWCQEPIEMDHPVCYVMLRDNSAIPILGTFHPACYNVLSRETAKHKLDHQTYRFHKRSHQRGSLSRNADCPNGLTDRFGCDPDD